MFAAQCVVSLGLLVWLFRGLDFAEIRFLLRTLPAWFYLLSLSVVVGGQILYVWRWRQVLAATGVHVSTWTAVQQYFIGIFLNNFFPSTVGGDMAKIYYLGRRHGYRAITASIFLDRLLSIGLLAVFSATMYWIAPDPSPRFVATRLVVTAMAVTLVLMIVLTAKGLTSGYAPLGAMITTDRLMEPFLHGSDFFAHGYTFGGHPVSTAVALKNMEIFEDEKINEGVREREGAFRGTLEKIGRAHV